MKRPNKFIVFSLGLILGLGFALGAGVLFLKVYRHAKKPKRFDALNVVSQLQGASIQKDLKVFVASSLDRIFKDGKTLLEPSLSTEAKIFAARNEYESFQIVVYSPEKDITALTLQTADLIDKKSGAIIPRQHISWRSVEYVPTITPYYPVKYVGYWPDPLVPVKSKDVPASVMQPFWVTIYVPAETPAGNYQSTVTVKGDGITAQEIPVDVHVYDFVLPVESHLKTAFDFYGHITKVRYPQGEKETEAAWQARIDDLNDRYIIEMLKYRMNPILNIDPTSQFQLGSIDRYRRYGINNFAIGRRGGTFNNNWPTDDESIEQLTGVYRTYAELLKLNGMLQDTYIYTWDEGPLDNPLVPKITGMIRRAHKELKNMVCYHGFWDPEANPEWGKDIDIWTFNIDDFVESKLRALQKIGKEMWMYISGPSGTGSANLAIDFDSIDYRIVPWLCWKYDIKGFLYWCVNWWEKVDPFLNAANTKWEQNGNGLLFYPGPDGPIASIRTEVFRDGMEDYEYIQMLIKKIKELQIMKLDEQYSIEIEQAIQSMTVDSAIVASMFEFTKDSAILLERRDAIARHIERIDQFLQTAREEFELKQKNDVGSQ